MSFRWTSLLAILGSIIFIAGVLMDNAVIIVIGWIMIMPFVYVMYFLFQPDIHRDS